MIYAIVASLCVWLYGFAQKMKAEMPEQSDNGFIFYTYLVFFVTGLWGLLITKEPLGFENIQAAYYAFWIMFLYTIIVKTRLLSLRYLSSSTYFINYRVASSTWLLLIGVLVFKESISMKEIIGLLIGFWVFYLLMEKKKEWESTSDFYKGLWFMLVWSICIAGLQGLNKDFALLNISVYALVFYSGIFGAILAFVFKGRESLRDMLRIDNLKYGGFVFSSGVVFAVATVTNNIAYLGGDLAIVYKIISYSLFIPIILSIVIYREQLTFKKLCAFALTVISIFLFI